MPGRHGDHGEPSRARCTGSSASFRGCLAAGEHGHVLATISGAGASGTMYGEMPYATTKAAILSMMECLDGELRDANADVRAGG